jgi:hypothetical protein
MSNRECHESSNKQLILQHFIPLQAATQNWQHARQGCCEEGYSIAKLTCYVELNTSAGVQYLEFKE